MKLIKTTHGYNFWKGVTKEGKPFFNVTPQDQKRPGGGYMSAEYICNVKDVPNYFILETN